MVVLSAIISTLFLSPLVFALAAGAGLLLLRRRRTAGWWVLAASSAIPLLLSLGPVSGLLLHTLERRNPPYDGRPVDAVVVLGGGVVNGSPEEGGRGSLAPDALKRLVYGSIIERRAAVPIVVSGGIVWNAPGAEAEAVVSARLLRDIGVPGSLIVEEGASRTTWENARNVASILKERRIGRVALVTSAYHMPRSLLAFRKAGVDCVPAPTDYKATYAAASVASGLPSFEHLKDAFVALREYFGIVQYSLR